VNYFDFGKKKARRAAWHRRAALPRY